MSKDLFLLGIPIFEPEYDINKDYTYSKEKGKQNLKELLLKTSDNYCMYCYSKVYIDNKLSGHLEHSIEKKNSYKLKDCNINISIACIKCNLSFKKTGEDKRALEKKEIELFESQCTCSEQTCLSPCDQYEDLKEIYLKKDTAEIILQPFGVVNKVTNNKYVIQYNLLEQEFIASEQFQYSDKEIEFINKHIERFNLNDSQYRTREIIKVCEDVTYFKQIPRKKRYDNLVADLFIDKLNSISLNDAIKLCERIIVYSELKCKT